MNEEATLQRQYFFYQPLGITLAILAISLLWMLFPGDLLTLALIAVGIIFLFGLKRPVWAMASLLVAQLTATSYMVNTPVTIISLRLLLLILIGFIIWRSHAQDRIDLGGKAKRVIIPVLILFGISVVANLTNSGFDYAYKDFRNMLVGLLIIIFLPAVIRNLKDLKLLCGVVFVGITISAIVAVVQHYQFLGMGQNTLTPGFLLQWGDQLRVPGIAETELELSFVLPVTTLAVIAIFLAKGVNNGNSRLLGASVVLMGLALYFTFTRSALLAIVMGLVALFLFLKTRIKGEIMLLIILLAIFVIEWTGVMEGTYLGGRSEAVQEESSVSRPILWQASIAIALDNPILGIGGDQFSRISPQYSSSVDPALIQWEQERYWGYSTLGSQAIHNDFLKMWVSYGTFALVAYLWFSAVVMRNFIDSYRASKRRFIKGLSVGLAAGFLAYMVNAFYHNCLTTMPLLWILAGFSVATAKLAINKKEHKQSRFVLNEASRKEES